MAEKIDVSNGDHDHQYDRSEMLNAFDETKAGVKGLIDSGLSKLPPIFVRPPEELAEDRFAYENKRVDHRVPVIDLSCGDRKQIVEQVRVASETFGFFQVINHGIPLKVLDEMIDGGRKFHEMDVEEKRRYYTRDTKKGVVYSSNFDLFKSRTANWRDTLGFTLPDQIESHEFPACCRESTVEYKKQIAILGNTLLELLSEGLGLKPDHLNSLDCSMVTRISCHYYPGCPEPELTLGATKHTDPGFITILLQNEISGLQIWCEGQWVDILPVSGGLVVNIGDFLQLVSNGKYISSKHRVVANSIGPRISVVVFLSGPFDQVKYYGPIKELISEENPPKYREILLSDYVLKFLNNSLEDYQALDYYTV